MRRQKNRLIHAIHFFIRAVHKFSTIDRSPYFPLSTCFINLLHMNQIFIKLSFEGKCSAKKREQAEKEVSQYRCRWKHCGLRNNKEKIGNFLCIHFSLRFRATKADRYAENYKLSCFRYKSKRCGDIKPEKAW